MNLPDCFLAVVPSRVVPLLALWLLTSTCRAGDFCFSMAESYYEQIYCEVQSAGQGNRLPTFRDFRNNPPMTQALLLKRPAERSGIKLVMPRSSRPMAATEKLSAPSTGKENGLPGCQLTGKTINCGERQYVVTGNQVNSNLTPGVLDEANKLGIPSSDEALHSGVQREDYLLYAYGLYLEKMLEIGLGGATFSYGKFAYFYRDATERGLDFTDRLETMFRYLKQDKRRIAVAEPPPDTSEVAADQCNRVAQRLIACTANGKNLVFVATKS